MRLALIAGSGGLPAAIAKAQEIAPLVCALEGHAPDALDVDELFRLETLGSFLKRLGARGVTDVCFCGSIARPAIDPTKIDSETRPLVPIFMAALQKGDDGALRAAMGIFEQTGFTIRAAHELLPGLTLEAGVPTANSPGPGHERDAELGAAVLFEMGQADLGQACILREGAVLAREDDSGTDAMLGRAAQEGAARGAILFKGPKPGQDRRADLPTIGPETARRAAEAGLAGIVIEAGAVIVLEKETVLRALDAAGLFLWVRAP